MSKIFNATEIADLGIEKEKKRRDFYDLVSRRFEDNRMKKLFSSLRDWEEEHIKKFGEIRERIAESEPIESYPGELMSYMQSLVGDMLYNQVSPDLFSQNVKTEIEAINFGISFEKDAILFFLEMYSFINTPHKEVIQSLIEEEKKHIIYLADLRKALKR